MKFLTSSDELCLQSPNKHGVITDIYFSLTPRSSGSGWPPEALSREPQGLRRAGNCPGIPTALETEQGRVCSGEEEETGLETSTGQLIERERTLRAELKWRGGQGVDVGAGGAEQPQVRREGRWGQSRGAARIRPRGSGPAPSHRLRGSRGAGTGARREGGRGPGEASKATAGQACACSFTPPETAAVLGFTAPKWCVYTGYRSHAEFTAVPAETNVKLPLKRAHGCNNAFK